MKIRTILLLTLLISFFSCQQAPKAPYEINRVAEGTQGMVVCAHPEASKVGIDILKKGGNAVDAAIAVQLALAVVYQRAGNLGGGGFMIYRGQDGETSTLDYREKAPLASDKDMYLDSAGHVIQDLSTKGHLAVGVPGSVAGHFAAHKKYGKLPFADLINPSIELAKNGFYLTQHEADAINKFQADITRLNTSKNVFMKDTPWKMGDKIIQNDLAEVLIRIRDKGHAGFYEGKTADLIVAEMQKSNGIITLEDLKKYEAQWQEPILFEYKDYKIISMGPPSSGGVALAQLMGMTENYPIADWGFHDPKSVHLMIEAERRAYSDRAQYLGDNEFYPVPLSKLVDETYLKERMNSFSATRASSSDSILAGVIPVESEQTTHLSVVDKDGNTVAVTTTLNSNFGSKVVVSGGGFFLNNEMDDFSSKPGVPNQFGLVGAEANAIHPEKRMLSSMTPTIVEKDGKPLLVLGSPGGSTIITTVYQVVVNVIEFGMTLEEAVNAPRFHHQWLPNKVSYETKLPMNEAAVKTLTDMGHTLEQRSAIGRVDAIMIRSDGTYVGVGDIRRDDNAMGY